MPRARSPWEAIFEKINTDGDCWLWEGKILSPGMGYGLVSQHAKWSLAHRLSFKTFVDDIPDGMLVLHHCDTPRCVNPAHLYLGTQKENIHDMMRKGRRTWDMCGQNRNHAPDGKFAKGYKAVAR